MSVQDDGPRRVRSRPRISAPKLGEYLDVTQARRRERIIHGQKFPRDYIRAMYRDAFDTLRTTLLSGGDVRTRLLDRARLIERKPAFTSWQSDANECAARAVRRLAAMYEGLPLGDVDATMTGSPGFSVNIEGVDVSVAPSVLLERRTPKGQLQRGALVVVMNQSIALSARSGVAVAELVRRALEEGGVADVHPELCMVVDVFNLERPLSTAPRARKRLSDEIESACREIAMRWSALAA